MIVREFRDRAPLPKSRKRQHQRVTSTRFESRFESRFDSRFDSRFESRFDSRFESRFDSRITMLYVRPQSVWLNKFLDKA